MSNPLSRYRLLYKKVARPNSITPFSKHVFMRTQNRQQYAQDPIGGIEDSRTTSYVHLKEPFTNTEVHLVGTMNTSTMLAKRTRDLVRDVQPDSVMVMASPQWWDSARLMEGVHSQQDFNKYDEAILGDIKELKLDQSYYRGAVFNFRMFLLRNLLKYHYSLPEAFKFYRPGLEIKYALEEAEKLGADLHFLGPELNNITWRRLYHEHRLNPWNYLLRNIQNINTRWDNEYRTFKAKMQLTEPAQLVESGLDRFDVNWYIKSLEMSFPYLKKILIDKRDMALYKYITRNTQEGQKIVAVVNQWHMEGIEHLWAHEYGQLPRSQTITDEIDPIGDMPLKDGLFDMLYNAFQRELKNANSKTTPASYSNIMNTYHREQNWQYEHRNM